MDISTLARDVAKKLNRHAPVILSAAASVGVLATGYLAHQAGVKATEKIITTQIEEGIVIEDPKRKVELVWKFYIAPTSVAMATIFCIITSSVISTKRQTALIGAYALGERAFATYREKMAEEIGEDLEKEVRAESVREQAADIREESEVPVGIDGKATFIDVFSGQMFISDLETVYRAMNNTNKKCAEDGYAPMNHFYHLVGARKTELGEVVGWNTERMMDLIITRVVKDGEEKDFEIYGIDYVEQPTMEYHRIW